MNKSKLKKGMTAALVAALIAAQAMPAFANEKSQIESTTGYYGTKAGTGSTKIESFRAKDGTLVKWSSGKQDTYPGWYWVDQYCYYYLKPRSFAKSTTTPDGYTVDELGRWTVNGVPQTNDYGHVVIGTDQLYAGKTDDDQLWAVMGDLLEKTYAEDYGDPLTVAMTSYGNWIQHSVGAYGTGFSSYAQDNISYMKYSDDIFVEATISPTWSDNVLNAHENLVGGSANTSAMQEKTYKILLGDHAGQELFDYIRPIAEPAEGGAMEVNAVDEQGHNISIPDEFGRANGKALMETISVSGDGINLSKFDTSLWQNRTTDYGKRFSITIENGGLKIKIYK